MFLNNNENVKRLNTRFNEIRSSRTMTSIDAAIQQIIECAPEDSQEVKATLASVAASGRFKQGSWDFSRWVRLLLGWVACEWLPYFSRQERESLFDCFFLEIPPVSQAVVEICESLGGSPKLGQEAMSVSQVTNLRGHPTTCVRLLETLLTRDRERNFIFCEILGWSPPETTRLVSALLRLPTRLHNALGKNVPDLFQQDRIVSLVAEAALEGAANNVPPGSYSPGAARIHQTLVEAVHSHGSSRRLEVIASCWVQMRGADRLNWDSLIPEDGTPGMT
jgi:hypothetical protein